MNKQTSVEWIFEQLADFIPREKLELMHDMLSHALASHENEIIEAWKDGEGHLDNDSQKEAEWYYYKTYGDEEVL
jgi:hypothetical protein